MATNTVHSKRAAKAAFGHKLADKMTAGLDVNSVSFTETEKNEIRIALADRALAEEIIAKMTTAPQTLTQRQRYLIQVALADKKAADDLIASIEA
jgi:hypothetical protein